MSLSTVPSYFTNHRRDRTFLLLVGGRGLRDAEVRGVRRCWVANLANVAVVDAAKSASERTMSNDVEPWPCERGKKKVAKAPPKRSCCSRLRTQTTPSFEPLRVAPTAPPTRTVASFSPREVADLFWPLLAGSHSAAAAQTWQWKREREQDCFVAAVLAAGAVPPSPRRGRAVRPRAPAPLPA